LREIKGDERHQSRKLVTTFLQRKKYVVHAANLALYLNLGLELVEVHRVLQFSQSKFLKSYIDHCTSKRASSKSEFKKNVFKLFSNSCYGKFIEQKRSHVDCKFVTERHIFRRWVGNPRFKSYKILGNGLTVCFLKKHFVRMEQAWAIGFTILEMSKHFVYDQYYNVIKPLLNNRCQVLFTDTDSFCLQVVSPMSELEIFEKLSPIMDFSNYPSSHPLYNPTRKNCLGYWKDELKSGVMTEFVGLASKTYSMTHKSPEGLPGFDSKCKGVGKGFRKEIPFTEFKNCLTSIKDYQVRHFAIRAQDHVIRTVTGTRKCFSSFDDKRYLLNCGIHSEPYGSVYICEDSFCEICDM
jgi:hypothetical protein